MAEPWGASWQGSFFPSDLTVQFTMVPASSRASWAEPGLLMDIYSAGLWDRCSRLRAPAPPPSGSSRLAAWASRSHAPATPRTGAPGWEEARPPPPAGESLGTLGHPGFSPHHWPPSRAESSDPAGRRPPPSQAALCTLPSALCLRPSPCLPRSCSLPDSPDAAPARRALPLRASARSRIRASEADRCSPGSDPGSPLLGRGSRTRTHTVQFQAGTGSREIGRAHV